jgi:pimeloyl-ACP methyl ester carboxylesterase
MFILQKYATFWRELTKYPQYLLTLSASLLACALLLIMFFCQQVLPPIVQQEVELPVETGVIKGTLWLPTPDHQAPSSPVPGIILVHGMASSRRTFETLAKTLAHNGMGAFVFDLQGYGESRHTTNTSYPQGTAADPYAIYRENVIESLRFLQAHPAIQADKIAFVGHSLGAEVLAQLPESTPGLRIAIGMHPSTSQRQESLQWWTGLYDPFHPAYVFPGTTAYVSACTDHSNAPHDLCLSTHLQSTLNRLFLSPAQANASAANASQNSRARVRMAHFYYWSTVALGACLLLLLATLPLASGGYPLLLPTLIAMAPFLIGGYFRWLYGPYCASAVCFFTLAYFVRQIPLAALKQSLKGLALLWGVHMLVSTLRGAYTLWILPALSLSALGSLSAWPVFVFQSLIGLVQMPHDKFLQWAFTQTYARLEPGLLFLGVFAIEAIWPGGLVRWIQQGTRLVLSGPTATSARPARSQALFLLGLIMILGATGYWRHQQGFLDIKILLNIQPLLGGVILPELLVLGFVYWRFQKVLTPEAPPR